MDGGALVRGWVYAAVALRFLDGFEGRHQMAIGVSESVITLLDAHDAFKVQRIPNGSNIFLLEVETSNPTGFRRRLNELGISLREPRDDGRFVVQVNETWGTTTAEDLVNRMQNALSGF